MNIRIKRKLVFALCSAFIVCASSCKNNSSPGNNNSGTSKPSTSVTSEVTQISSDVYATQSIGNPDTSAGPGSSEETQIQPVSADSDTIIIDDKVFITMLSDIYANTDNYMGKTISLSGMFDIFKDDQSGKTYYSIYKYDTAGCCSYGMEVDWDEIYNFQLPKQDQNVTATGVLDRYEENGQQYLVLHLSDLTIL